MKKIYGIIFIVMSFGSSIVYAAQEAETPQQLCRRVWGYVWNTREILLHEDVQVLKRIDNADLSKMVWTIFEQNKRNYERYSFSTAEAQFVEGLVADAQREKDLYFKKNPDMKDFWERFICVETFYRGDESVPEVRLFKMWQRQCEYKNQAAQG